jgi:hypothetical protein
LRNFWRNPRILGVSALELTFDRPPSRLKWGSSSGPIFGISARAQRTLLHTWIILVIAKQHLVQIDRIDGPAEYLSQILAAIRAFRIRAFAVRVVRLCCFSGVFPGAVNVGRCYPHSRLQGYLAHKKRHSPLGPPQGPRHRPTVGSKGSAVSYARGTPAPRDCRWLGHRESVRISVGTILCPYGLFVVQGYFIYKKTHPPGTLQ